MTGQGMHLKLMTPTGILADLPVSKIIAEADNGFFCLLPRHIDFVSSLVPGILYFVDNENREKYYAVNEGTLVKVGTEVRISTFNAVAGDSLDELQTTIEHEFSVLDDQERSAQSALARLEAGTIRRFVELEEQLHA